MQTSKTSIKQSHVMPLHLSKCHENNKSLSNSKEIRCN